MNPELLAHLIHRTLPGPYQFEVDTHPSVEVTVFHQKNAKRILVDLLSMQESLPAIPVGASLRIQLPASARVKKVYRIPNREALPHEALGDYTQVRLEPFQMFTMLIVEYD